MQTDPSVFEKKPVFDWNHVPLGHVASTTRNPKTRDTRQLVLALTDEAKQQLGTDELTLELPASMIFATRRDAVTLNRSLTELRRTEPFGSMMKK